jgi:hypothetical protein
MSPRWEELTAMLEDVEADFLEADRLFEAGDWPGPGEALDIAARLETIRRGLRRTKELVAKEADDAS